MKRRVRRKGNRATTVLALVILLAAVAAPVAATSSCARAARFSGLCFSPYPTADRDAAGPVEELLEEIAPHTGGIRTFGSTGDWATIPGMAKELGLYTAAGAGITDDPEYSASQVAGLIDLVKTGDVDLAVVGDENLMWETASESRMLTYIRRVKKAGIPTTTSEGWEELLAHPAVVREVDVVVMNVFPFWEGIARDDSVDYIDAAYRKVKARAGGKEVIVETGWPSAGEPEREAVPSSENAGAYLREFDSWARANGVRYFYFEAIDEPWKRRTEGSVGPHWGLWDRDGKMKDYTRSLLNETG